MRSSSSERDDRKPPAMREDKTKEEAEEVWRREEKKREQRAAAAAAAVAGVLGGKDYRSWSPVTAPPADRWSGWSRGGGWQQKEWWREQPQREERQPWEVRLQCRDEGNRAELAAVFGVQQKVQVPVQLRPALERQAPKPGTTTTGSRAGRSLGLLCCRPGGKHLPGHDASARGRPRSRPRGAQPTPRRTGGPSMTAEQNCWLTSSSQWMTTGQSKDPPARAPGTARQVGFANKIGARMHPCIGSANKIGARIAVVRGLAPGPKVLPKVHFVPAQGACCALRNRVSDVVFV